jgi:hypothetical protein
MLARGYDGEVRSLPQEKMDISNWFILGFGGVVLLLVVALSLVIGL